MWDSSSNTSGKTRLATPLGHTLFHYTFLPAGYKLLICAEIKYIGEIKFELIPNTAPPQNKSLYFAIKRENNIAARVCVYVCGVFASLKILKIKTCQK